MIQITPIEFILSMPKNKAHSISSKKNLRIVHVCNRLPSPSEHSTLDIDTNTHVEHLLQNKLTLKCSYKPLVS